jgi:hypothetical protein
VLPAGADPLYQIVNLPALLFSQPPHWEPTQRDYVVVRAEASLAAEFVQATGSAGVQLSELIPDLSKLRAAMRQEASDSSHDVALGEIAKAEDAAKKGMPKG